MAPRDGSLDRASWLYPTQAIRYCPRTRVTHSQRSVITGEGVYVELTHLLHMDILIKVSDLYP